MGRVHLDPGPECSVCRKGVKRTRPKEAQLAGGEEAGRQAERLERAMLGRYCRCRMAWCD